MYYRYLLYIKDNTKYAYLKNYLIRCYLIVYVIVFKFNKIDYIAHIITLCDTLKPTQIQAHLVFPTTKTQRQKPKELEFYQRSKNETKNLQN